VLVPPLVATSYKGSSGKVGVVGGCFEYTGAPFYAALTALKLGADLSHVFCDEAAAVPIKSYSPELIVHGCLRGAPEVRTRIRDATSELPKAVHSCHCPAQVDLAEVARQADEVSKWFPALTARSVPRLNLTPDSIKTVPRQALVVGPGLGRDATMQAVAALLLERAVRASLPCVIDADGLRCVLERPSLVRGARWVVLTPNKPEYGRLAGALSGDAELDPADRDWLFSDPRVTSIASRGSLVSRPTEIAPSSRWRSRSETREGRARRSSKRGRPARLCNGPSAYQLVHES
jgi:ATP-dependent NAD(P)H-hydrate dehydratase